MPAFISLTKLAMIKGIIHSIITSPVTNTGARIEGFLYSRMLFARVRIIAKPSFPRKLFLPTGPSPRAGERVARKDTKPSGQAKRNWSRTGRAGTCVLLGIELILKQTVSFVKDFCHIHLGKNSHFVQRVFGQIEKPPHCHLAKGPAAVLY